MRISCSGMRVNLRTPEQEDAGEIARNANDYDIAKDVASSGEFPYPYTTQDAMAFIGSSAGARSAGIGYHFVICVGKPVIGACGLFNISARNRSCDIGYWIGKGHWGKGYAKEAVLILLQFGFGSLQLNRIQAYTFASNSRSVSLLKSMGFSTEGVLRESVVQEGRYVDDMLFSKLAREHKALSISIDG